MTPSEGRNASTLEAIQHRILLLRETNRAKLYGVSTKVLNQAVKRTIERFPEDFLFQLTEAEKNEVIANCDQLPPTCTSSPQLVTICDRSFTPHIS